MTRNLNSPDRIVRSALGIALAALAALAILADASVTGAVLAVLAVVMLGTAAVGFCPLYAALGISTCPAPHRTRRGHVGAPQGS